MVKTIFVRPLDGLKVPHPTTGIFLKEEGEEVEANSYWTRRELAKEVEVLSETKDAKANKVKGSLDSDSQGGK